MIDVELDGWFGLKGLSGSGVEAVIRHYFVTLSTDGCGEESEQTRPGEANGGGSDSSFHGC